MSARSGVPRDMRFVRVTSMEQRSLAALVAVAGLSLSACQFPISFDDAPTAPVIAADPPPTTTIAPSAPPTPGTSTTPTTSTTSTTSTTPSIPTSLIIGFDATPPDAGWVRPGLADRQLDPAYGNPVRRLTSADGTRFNRNTYSRRQAENADGTRVLTYHGDAQYQVHDRTDGDLLAVLPIHPAGEPQWHPTDPSIIRHMAGDSSSVGDLRYHETRFGPAVDTSTTTVIADLTSRIRAVHPDAAFMIDRAEGTPSRDGNRLAWIVYDDGEQPIAIVSYDLATDSVLGMVDLPSDLAASETGPLDWVSASPTGDYVMAGYWHATVVFDADLTNPRTINDKADHSDIALSAAGRDTFVTVNYNSGPDAGWLTATDLETLTVTRLFDLYADATTSLHISGKAFDRPGWVVVSTYRCKVPGAWTCNKVMAVELGGHHDVDGASRVVNLAHTYNCGDDYWTEPHAVANRDLSRVYVNSDAGSCGIDAEVYEITVPALD